MSQGDQFDRAVLCVFDQSNQANQYRNRAQNFLDQYKKNKDYWQLLMKKLLDPRTDEAVMFYCIQNLFELIKVGFYSKALSPNDQKRFRRGLMQWISNVVTKKKVRMYLKNKYSQVVVFLFSKEYLQTWKGFFKELFQFVGQSHKRPRNEFTVILDMFLRILHSIDEDLFHLRTLSSGHLRALKERMREDCVKGLANIWKKILDMEIPSLSTFCLTVMARYIDWIDINLMTGEDYIQRFYKLIKIPETRKESMEVFNAFVLKGMPSIAKLQMIERLKLIPLLKNLSNCNFRDEREQLFFAALTNATGLQILEGWAKIPDKTVPFRLLRNLMDSVLMVLVSNRNFKVVFKILGFFRQYARVLKHKQRANGRCTPNEIKQMKFLLSIILKSTVYPQNFKFDLARQEDVEARFEEYRRSWFQIYERIVDLLGKEIIVFINPVMRRTFQNLKDIQFPQLEISLRLFYNCLDKYESSDGRDSNEGFFRHVVCEIIRKRIIRFPHQEIKKLYFDVVAKWSYLLAKLENRQERGTLIKEVLDAFLGIGFSSQNIQVRGRCYRQFLKFVQCVRSVLIPFLDELVRRILPFMKLEPELPRQADEFGRHQGLNINAFQGARIVDYKIDLYEAIGVLLSMQDVQSQRRIALLKVVIKPVMQQIRNIMGKELYRKDRPDQPVFSVLLSKNIQALASVVKAFPKDGKIEKDVLEIYKTVFLLVMDVFAAIPHNQFIRHNTCSFMKSLMPLYPHLQISNIFSPAIKKIFSSSQNARELAHVFSIIVLIMNFVHKEAYPMINSLLIPITKKTLELTNNGEYLKFPKNIESNRSLLECHREYMKFLLQISQSHKGCFKAFFSNENRRHFIRVIEVAVQASDANGDVFSRICSDGFKVIQQLVMMSLSLQKKNNSNDSSVLNFVFSRILPVILIYPLKPWVDVTSAECMNNIKKTVNIIKFLSKEYGNQLRQFLNTFLPKSRLQMNQKEVGIFINSIFNNDHGNCLKMFVSLYNEKKKLWISNN